MITDCTQIERREVLRHETLTMRALSYPSSADRIDLDVASLLATPSGQLRRPRVFSRPPGVGRELHEVPCRYESTKVLIIEMLLHTFGELREQSQHFVDVAESALGPFDGLGP